MFDVDTLVADCQGAVNETEPYRAVREVLERTMAQADAVGDALRPRRGGLDVLYSAPDLTVLHVVWAPGMVLFPHDHLMWAAIGIYAGQEDNAFYRRRPDRPTTVTATGGKELRAGDVLLLGTDAIHGVTNPLDRITAAIHVYGGDFVNQPRSQWGPGPLEERPYNFGVVQNQFAEANTAAGLTA
jgi:predicted metal-dependent enzyme (double-stranded beta helix superfamily)